MLKATIIHTASLLNMRGSEMWVIDVSSLLQEASVSVNVIDFDYSRKYPKNDEEIKLRLHIIKEAFENVPLTRLAALSLRLPLSGIWRGTPLEQFVEKYLHFLPLSPHFYLTLCDSDVIYFVVSQASPSYLIVVLAISALAGWKPVVAGIHVTPKMTSYDRIVLRLFAKMGILKAVHITNEAHKSEFIKIGCDVDYIPNGVYYERFASNVAQKLPQDRFSVLYVGAMTRMKGADLLPEIYLDLKKMEIPFRLTICTSGGELEDNIKEWSKGKDDVIFKGFVGRNELSKIYAQSSVALFPSRREAFPLACLEVQASGTPVVVADLPGLTQAVVNHVTSVVVSSNDPESFASGIAEIFAIWKYKPHDYAEMCRNAQAYVRDNFQWKGIVRRLVNLLVAQTK